VGSSRTEERYDDLGLIGEGGMGEVRRVWDTVLHRAVAMKILKRELAEREDLVLRFVEEAQATGQLEHPGIVPVYDLGHTRDGRPYFTMKEIRGRSLLDVIEEVHLASGNDGWGTTPSGWTFQRLVDTFLAVCEAVAYAHSRGVLHRDLKPTNVMVGPFGEVAVMDWGLAKVREAAAAILPRSPAPVVTSRSRGAKYVTVTGAVAGTPNYMPPEQARGDAAKVGPWSDVYALGAILYEILADRAPYDGADLDEVVAQVLAGPPPPPIPSWRSEAAAPRAEEGLRKICDRAMCREIAGRTMDASALAEQITDWLETAGARERAVALVDRADRMEPELVDLRKRTATLRARAGQLLAALPPDASPADKQPAWSLEDEAATIERELSRAQARYAHLLYGALASVPDLREASAKLERLAEWTGQPRPGSEVDDGWLSLATRPAHATVVLERFVVEARRKVARVVGVPSPVVAPIENLPLAPGSLRLRVEAEGHAPLVVCAVIEPGKPWVPAPPGSTRPVALALAATGEDPDDAVRVHAGWAWVGGDREANASLPRTRVWTDAFLVQRHPVTNAAFLAFLEAWRRAGRPATTFAPTGFRQRASGWELPAGAAEDEPVHRVTFEAATAYAGWLASTTGRPWRLPREREWEKAARGGDERLYPWGDFLDPAWCCIAESHAGRVPRPAPIDAYPQDESPYGVRGMGGNVRDWVVDDRAPRTGPVLPIHRFVKGGHFLGAAQLARSALRFHLPVPWEDGTGFRLVCGVD
jgi:serine/threonine-protein kinase